MALQRYTPLTAGKPLGRGTSQLRRTELKRASRLSPGMVRLKRSPLKAGRVKLAAAKTGGRAVVIDRTLGGWCEIQVPLTYAVTWRCQEQGTDFSHRWGQGTAGPDLASNGLWACRLCHSWCHAHPAKAKDQGWMLRSLSETLTEPAWYQGNRWVLLDDKGGIIPSRPPQRTEDHDSPQC